jgi:hypothetical protein
MKSGPSRRGLPRGPYKPRGGGGDSSLVLRSKRSSSRFLSEFDGADDSPAPASPSSSVAGTAFPSSTMAPLPLSSVPPTQPCPAPTLPSFAPPVPAPISAAKPGMRTRLRVSSATGAAPPATLGHFVNRRLTSPPSSPEAIAPAGTSTRRAKPVQTPSRISPPPPFESAQLLAPPPPPVTTPFSIALPHS